MVHFPITSEIHSKILRNNQINFTSQTSIFWNGKVWGRKPKILLHKKNTRVTFVEWCKLDFPYCQHKRNVENRNYDNHFSTRFLYLEQLLFLSKIRKSCVFWIERNMSSFLPNSWLVCSLDMVVIIRNIQHMRKYDSSDFFSFVIKKIYSHFSYKRK